jgi:ketosteroid isomerase-like protein
MQQPRALRRFRTGVLAGLLVLPSLAAPAAADTPTEAARDIAQLFYKACSEQDVEAVAALYTDDAIVIWPPAGAEGVGPAAGRDFATKFCTKDAPPLELVKVEGRDIGAGQVLAHGTWKQTVTAADGTKTTFPVRTTEIIVARDGKWKYLVDHASIGVPAPAAAAAEASK